MVEWENRIVGSDDVDPKALVANEANWRTHPEYQRAALRGVLDAVGWVDDVIVNRTTGRLVDGHLRVDLAIERGEKRIPVKYVDLSEDEEALVLATFDPIAAAAQADAGQLAALVARLETSDAAIMAIIDDVAGRAGVFDEDFQLPSLDEVAAEWGEGDADEFWPNVSVRVPPDVFEKWEAHRTEFSDDVAAFAVLLS